MPSHRIAKQSIKGLTDNGGTNFDQVNKFLVVFRCLVEMDPIVDIVDQGFFGLYSAKDVMLFCENVVLYVRLAPSVIGLRLQHLCSVFELADLVRGWNEEFELFQGISELAER